MNSSHRKVENLKLEFLHSEWHTKFDEATPVSASSTSGLSAFIGDLSIMSPVTPPKEVFAANQGMGVSLDSPVSSDVESHMRIHEHLQAQLAIETMKKNLQIPSASSGLLQLSPPGSFLGPPTPTLSPNFISKVVDSNFEYFLDSGLGIDTPYYSPYNSTINDNVDPSLIYYSPITANSDLGMSSSVDTESTFYSSELLYPLESPFAVPSNIAAVSASPKKKKEAVSDDSDLYEEEELLTIKQIRSLFKCNIKGCGRAYPKHHMLKSHKKSHTMKDGSTCRICGFAFRRHTDLNRHMRQKHVPEDQMELFCKGCNKGFGRMDMLKRHLTSKTKECPGTNSPQFIGRTKDIEQA